MFWGKFNKQIGIGTSPFDLVGKPRPPRNRTKRLTRWIGRKRERFTYFIVLSAFAHVTLLGSLMIFWGTHTKPVDPTRSQDEFSAFREALRDVNPLPDDPDRLAEFLATLTDREITEAFKRSPRLDDRLTHRERAAIYKTLIAKSLSNYEKQAKGRSNESFSLEDLFGDNGVSRELPSPDGSKLYGYGGVAGTAVQYYRLSPEASRKIESYKETGRPGGDSILSGSVEVRTEGGRFLVPAEYFFRQGPYEQLLAVGARLFYFVGGFPDLENPVKEVPRQPTDALTRRNAPSEAVKTETGLSVILIKRLGPDDKGSLRAPSQTPIGLTEGNIDLILDNLMEKSDGEQLEKFDRDYLQRYDPNSPLLARLTRELIYRNLGTVFLITDPLSVGFDYLEGVYFRKLSMERFISFYLDHRDTRTGTEILFCLAAFYDFERRCLERVRESSGIANKIVSNPSYPIEVFDKRAKAFVLRQISGEIATEVKNKRAPGIEAVLQEYRKQQVRIYGRLLSMGGEVKDRALFSLGSLYWSEGRVDLAIRTWKEISASFSSGPFPQIRGYIALGEPGFMEDNISRLLGQEAATNSLELLERLAKFHKWEKRAGSR